jgi:hypothetical protein
MSKSKTPKTDVSDRLLTFVSGCLGLAGSFPEGRVSNALADSLLKPSVASYFRHGEAEGSPSAKEFTEKFREVLKELRTTRRALQMIQKTAVKGLISLGDSCDLDSVKDLLEQADELVRTFFQSVRVLENKVGN